MSLWNITYSYNHNTEVLTINSDQPPSMEQAVAALLGYARKHYPVKRPSTDAQEERTEAVQLAECFGITVTGITKASQLIVEPDIEEA